MTRQRFINWLDKYIDWRNQSDVLMLFFKGEWADEAELTKKINDLNDGYCHLSVETVKLGVYYLIKYVETL